MILKVDASQQTSRRFFHDVQEARIGRETKLLIFIPLLLKHERTDFCVSRFISLKNIRSLSCRTNVSSKLVNFETDPHQEFQAITLFVK